MSRSVADEEAGWADEPVYAQLARLGKALSNPLRIRLLDLLEQGEHTVEELASAARQPVKNTSAQLQVLRTAQLVTSRRDGVRVHYRLAGPHVTAFLGRFEGFAEHTLDGMRVEIGRLLDRPGGLEQVGVEEFQERMAVAGTVIVDVRSAAEYARGHLPGAVSIPLDELRRRIDELPTGADVIAYCEGPYCFSSADAVALFAEAGREVVRLRGGVVGWVRAGRELTDRAQAR